MKEGYEQVFPHRSATAKLSTSGRIYITGTLLTQMGVGDIPEDNYQVFFNPKSAQGIIRLVKSSDQAEGSFRLTRMVKKRTTVPGQSESLHFFVLPLIQRFKLKLAAGSVPVAWVPTEREFHFDMTARRRESNDKNTRDVMEITS